MATQNLSDISSSEDEEELPQGLKQAYAKLDGEHWEDLTKTFEHYRSAVTPRADFIHERWLKARQLQNCTWRSWELGVKPSKQQLIDLQAMLHSEWHEELRAILEYCIKYSKRLKETTRDMLKLIKEHETADKS
jgi:hypothetical protein